MGTAEIGSGAVPGPVPAQAVAPVMVGVDGSKASVHAALWAAEEAVARGTTLDLVYVSDPACHPDGDDALAAARNIIHRVWRTVTAASSVRLEAEILRGEPGQMLIDAARRAAMICVGHQGDRPRSDPRGTHRKGRSRPRGATAAALVGAAPTTVTVVRHRPAYPGGPLQPWILAVLDESESSPQVLRAALEESLVRHAPIMALTTWSTSTPLPVRPPDDAHGIREELDRCLRDRRDDQAGLRMCALPMPVDLLATLTDWGSIVQLVVLSAHNHELVDALTTQRARKALRRTRCSLMVL